MERLAHWWNGSWGRLARRDVFLYRDGDAWIVQARAGGADGRSMWRSHPSEAEARRSVDRLLAPQDGWRQLD